VSLTHITTPYYVDQSQQTDKKTVWSGNKSHKQLCYDASSLIRSLRSVMRLRRALLASKYEVVEEIKGRRRTRKNEAEGVLP